MDYRAAVTLISTSNCVVANLASTQERTGILPELTHPSQTSFIAEKNRMSDSQIVGSDRHNVLTRPSLATWVMLYGFFPKHIATIKEDRS